MCARMDREIAKRRESIDDLYEVLRDMDATTVEGSNESVFYATDRETVLREVEGEQRELDKGTAMRERTTKMFQDRILPVVKVVLLRQRTLQNADNRNGVFTKRPDLRAALMRTNYDAVISIDKICRVLFDLPPVQTRPAATRRARSGLPRQCPCRRPRHHRCRCRCRLDPRPTMRCSASRPRRRPRWDAARDPLRRRHRPFNTSPRRGRARRFPLCVTN